jgi:hypothetical protein
VKEKKKKNKKMDAKGGKEKQQEGEEEEVQVMKDEEEGEEVEVELVDEDEDEEQDSLEAANLSFSNAEIGQACNEGLVFLLKMPIRRFIHVVLCNFHKWMFIKVERTATGFGYEVSGEFEANLGFPRFFSLLSQDQDYLNCMELPQILDMTYGKHLGSGATSSVFQGKLNKKNVAVKVLGSAFSGLNFLSFLFLRFVVTLYYILFYFIYSELAKAEIDALKFLKEIAGVPKLEVPQPPPGVVVLSPVLDRVTAISWAQVQNLAHTLSQVHFQGLVHRDLRKDNIMSDGRGGIFLVDFGFAQSQHQTSQHSGAITTASSRILTLLQEHGTSVEFGYLPDDDWQSFVRVSCV